MAKTVIGILENPGEAQQAVDELLKSGFQRRDIGVISSDILREAATAATGASKGMAFGALAGMLLGAATMAIPGFGPLLVAGPGLALLGGTTLGALAGGIVGALKARGMPEEQANFYAEGVRRGGTLITINAITDDLAQRAVEILKRHGAVDVEQRIADWKRLGWGGRIERIARRGKKKTADTSAAQAKPAQAAPATPARAEAPAATPARAEAEAEAPARAPAAAEPLDVSPVAPLAAVEVYSLVIEMPDDETETETAADTDTAPRAERRTSRQPYAGEERRRAA
jgi:hypothetical protein